MTLKKIRQEDASFETFLKQSEELEQGGVCGDMDPGSWIGLASKSDLIPPMTYTDFPLSTLTRQDVTLLKRSTVQHSRTVSSLLVDAEATRPLFEAFAHAIESHTGASFLKVRTAHLLVRCVLVRCVLVRCEWCFCPL